MKKFLAIWFALTISAFGANWYVRPSATGSATGHDWNNAWSLTNLDNNWSSVSPGDTVWIAGGTYSDQYGLQCIKSGTSANPILVYRATANDAAATSAAGWNASFNSQAVIQGGVHFPAASYITVDGRTSSGFYWASGAGGGYGSTAAMATSFDGSPTNVTGITLRYMEMDGSANTTGNSGPTYGVNWAPTGGALSVTGVVDHVYAHTMSEPVRSNGWNGVVVQYCVIGDTNNFGDHEDLAFMYQNLNTIFRYNTFYGSGGDGIFIQHGSTNFYLYGNCFFGCGSGLITVGNTDGGTDGPYYIWNNFFGGVPSAPPAAIGFTPSGGGIGPIDPRSQCYNNVFWFCLNGTGNAQGFTLSDYNAYSYTNLQGSNWPGNSAEPHSFTFSNNPFVGPIQGALDPQNTSQNGNAHFSSSTMAAPFANGLALAPLNGFINVDGDANTRGAPWYIGAYQFSTGSPTPTPTPAPTPAPVTNLHVVPG